MDTANSYYLATDGIIDQVGGPKARSYGKKRFKATLNDINGEAMGNQAEMLKTALADYQGDQPRRDDVSVIGFRID